MPCLYVKVTYTINDNAGISRATSCFQGAVSRRSCRSWLIWAAPRLTQPNNYRYLLSSQKTHYLWCNRYHCNRKIYRRLWKNQKNIESVIPTNICIVFSVKKVVTLLDIILFFRLYTTFKFHRFSGICWFILFNKFSAFPFPSTCEIWQKVSSFHILLYISLHISSNYMDCQCLF